MNITLLSILFLILCAGMATVVLWTFARYLQGNARVAGMIGFIAWLTYAGILGEKGIIALKSPPGPAFVLVPALLFLILFLAWHPSVKGFASRIPISLLIGLQGFRLFVELALFALYQNHLLPQAMTFEGGNIDIVTGVSAPIVAWLYVRRRIGDTALRVWSVLGIVLLANAVARALLTFTGLLKTDIPNIGIGLFPFTFLPGFLVPLALYLHLLVLRAPSRSQVTP